MNAEEIAHLQRLRDKQQRNVWKLKEQAAEYGNDAPLNIINDIEDLEAELAQLDKQLEAAQATVAAAPAMAAVAAPISGAPVQPIPLASPAPAAQAVPPSASPAPAAGLPMAPHLVMLYASIAVFVLTLFISPFAGPVDGPLSMLVGLAWAVSLVLIVGVLVFMLVRRLRRNG